MKPILYNEFETAFDSNGLGILGDTIDISVDQELNGIYELEMKYPVFGPRFADLQHRAIILSTVDPVSRPQPFRIYRINPVSRGTVTVYARHLAYDLMGIAVSPFTATHVAEAFGMIPVNAVTGCPFSFQTDKDTVAEMPVPVPKTAWSLLGGSKGSILDVYGGEYEFDRWSVSLHNRRGADRGVSIRYGKNLTSLEQDANCANCFTGVYPYWTDQEGNLVTLSEKILRAEGTFSYTKIYPLDLSAEWDTKPTEEQLRARAEAYMADNEIGKPTVSIKVEFVPLAQTEEYKDMASLEQVMLGDTISVYFPQLLITTQARVVKTRWKPLLDRYGYVTVGRVRANIADTIAGQQTQIDQKPELKYSRNMRFQSNGLWGYGENDAGEMKPTLYIMPALMGSQTINQTCIAAASGVDLVLYTADTAMPDGSTLEGGFVRIGMGSGDKVKILGKVVSWKENEDGTFALVGTQ